MKDLIKRLEEATEGSRELDALIYVGIGSDGWTMDEWLEVLKSPDVYPPQAQPSLNTPAFTTSLDAAMTLVPPKRVWVLSCSPFTGGIKYVAWVRKTFNALPEQYMVYDADGYSSFAPIALCIAALRARQEG